jgi:4-amino-4-deoxy-L-arabinose transferase-like glycosyltransferase
MRPLVQSVILIAILLLGLALRLAPLGQNRFLEDEALYAYWGLQIASGADPLLDLEPVDKPPLYPYALALSFAALGGAQPAGAPGWGGETAARLPSLLASMASIALVYALGWQLYADTRVGLLAALLLALSPFDILFASTAFTDPLLTAFVLGALLAAARGRLGAAGLLCGLAAATKQQGLLFLPLVAIVGWVTAEGLRKSGKLSNSRWLRFALGFALVAGAVVWWDLSREQRPGFLEQSLISYGGLAPAGAGTLGERAAEWLSLLGGFWTSPWLNGLLLLGLVGWPVCWLAGRWTGRGAGEEAARCPAPGAIDLALAGYLGAYLALHWLVGFQVWDRYLLVLVPLAALLAARAFVILGDAIRAPRWRQVYAAGLGLVLLLALAGPALQAAHSRLPFGGDHGAYDGIDELATALRAEAAPGSVLYHHWLGYHYRFYLHGAPLRDHWYPDLEDLARDATVYRREPRYIAFPSWRDRAPAEAALVEAGIGLAPVLETARRDGTVSFRLYRLEGPE